MLDLCVTPQDLVDLTFNSFTRFLRGARTIVVKSDQDQRQINQHPERSQLV